MKISLIVARSQNNVIGKDNKMPWHLPADLKHFKAVTMGKPIVMGRKTFESIGRALPGRRNIVMSCQKDLVLAGCDVFHTMDDVLEAVHSASEVMIIGGANLYAQWLDRVDCIYMTVVEAEFDGDAFFPELNKTDWQLVSEEKHFPDDKNKYSYRFQVWLSQKAKSRCIFPEARPEG